MAPIHTTGGSQGHYPIISSVAPAHTTDGPHKSEYSTGGVPLSQRSFPVGCAKFSDSSLFSSMFAPRIRSQKIAKTASEVSISTTRRMYQVLC